MAVDWLDYADFEVYDIHAPVLKFVLLLLFFV